MESTYHLHSFPNLSYSDTCYDSCIAYLSGFFHKITLFVFIGSSSICLFSKFGFSTGFDFIFLHCDNMVTGVLHFSIYQMTAVSMRVATGRDAILFLIELVVDALSIVVMEKGIRFVGMTGTRTTASVTFSKPNVLTTSSSVSTILEVASPNSGLVRKSTYTYSKCWIVCGA